MSDELEIGGHPSVHLILDGEGAFADKADRVVSIGGGALTFALLRGGMASGAYSVAIGVELHDGKFGVAQTSLAALRAAVRGLEGRVQFEGGTLDT